MMYQPSHRALHPREMRAGTGCESAGDFARRLTARCVRRPADGRLESEQKGVKPLDICPEGECKIMLYDYEDEGPPPGAMGGGGDDD